jgi:hypothetical protein
MKNIHVLPTEKPSRLCFRNYYFINKDNIGAYSNVEFKNIYITSDEEIKEGDWMYYKHFGEDIVCKYDTMNGQNTNVNEHKPFYQKIILTTDGDLIKDGVQAIDDEFLEWFVNNSSCEFVEVAIMNKGYDKKEDFPYQECYRIIIPKEEPKQETLEEAAKRLIPDNFVQISSKQVINAAEISRYYFKEGFNVAKTTMYDDEEAFNLCRAFATFVQRKGPSYQKQQEWFKQFKKK